MENIDQILNKIYSYFDRAVEFLKNIKKRVFCEYGVCLNADSKASGCAIDMVDGASETLDLILFKRNMIEFSSNVIGR